MTRTEIAARLSEISYQLFYGCGNHGCRIKAPTRMATNGVCRCSFRKIADEFLELAIELEKLKYEQT